MADTFSFELVSPEKRLVAMDAREVQIPGAEGDLTAMPLHAPMITTLRPGILRASGPSGEQRFVVTGGFAEVTPEAASVLAERAMPVEEATASVLDALLEEAKTAAEAATEEDKAAADKLVSDIHALRAAVGA